MNADAPPPSRIVIERIAPEIDGGRVTVKRIVGEPLIVEADIFSDRSGGAGCCGQVRRKGVRAWSEVPMIAGDNDRWRGEVRFAKPGIWQYDY